MEMQPSSALRKLAKRRKVIWLPASMLVWLVIAGPGAFGSSLLLRGARRGMPEPTAVKTFGGPARFTLTEVKPATQLTVVWAMGLEDSPNSAGSADAPDPNDAKEGILAGRAHADLARLLEEPHGRPIRLAILRNGKVDLTAPLSSAAELDRALTGESGAGENAAGNDSQASTTVPAPAVAPGNWLDTLNRNAGKLGSQWSPVLVVGRLPELDSASQLYAQSLLARTFAALQLRVFLFAAPGDAVSWEPLFASTGGAIVSSLADLNSSADEAGQRFEQVSWSPGAPSAGFAAILADVSDGRGQRLAEAPDLAEGEGALPTIAGFAKLQQQLAEAGQLLRQQPWTEDSMARVREILFTAQKTNPIDPALLRAETDYCVAGGAMDEALKAAALLTQVRPEESNSWVLLGHTQIRASNWDQAEISLKRATELKAPASAVAEEYARLHLGRNDDRGALPYLKQALDDENNRIDLWLLQAQVSTRLQDRALGIHSLEEAIELGDGDVRDAGALIRLYAAENQTAKARTLAAKFLAEADGDAANPAGASGRAEFAQALEEAKLPEESRQAWQSVLALRPESEEACLRISAELQQALNPVAAQQFLDAGIAAYPKSSGIYLAKAAMLERQARYYEARRTLETGATATGDPKILARLATVQEAYADRAEAVYAQLAEALAGHPEERLAALQGGFHAALRDGELQQAAAFAGQLDAAGEPGAKSILGELPKPESVAVVPGGLDGLAIAALMRPGISPERFFVAYARTLTARVCLINCTVNEYADRIEAYFDSVAQLEALGKRDGNRVTVTLVWSGDAELRHSEAVLDLLGLELRSHGGKTTVVQGENGKQARRHALLAAIGVDEVGIAEAQQNGKPFSFELNDEPAQVTPGLDAWAQDFPVAGRGGFAQMLLESPRAARLYVGLGSLDHHTRKVLLQSASLKELGEHHADALALYGAAFAVHGGHAAVPGGTAAEPAWEHAVGASPAEPGAFFTTLLRPSNSGMLAFFYTLSQLDTRHQGFFTANATRLGRFEAIFASMETGGDQERSPAAHSVLRGNTAFADLLRSVPLDAQEHIAFPGSSRVWSSLKSGNAEGSRLAGMMKKIPATTSADAEDEVLLRLADTHYLTDGVDGTELDNFLAVARINAHRVAPLDEDSALLLAQRYPEFAPVYPYFSDLRAVGSAGFRSMFAAFDRMRKLPLLDRNEALGQFHGLLEWDALLSRRRVIDDQEAARLFDLICGRMEASSDEASRTSASVTLAGTMIADCAKASGTVPANLSWDVTLRACWLGSGDSNSQDRVKDFRDVLRDLKAPALDAVHAIDEGAAAILKSPADAAAAASIAKAAQLLPAVPLPRQARSVGNERESILLYDPAPLQRLAAELAKAAAQAHPDEKSLQRLASDIRKTMGPQVTLALAAPIYAVFLRSSDIVVAEDPLLLRKHRYFDYGTIAGQKGLLASSEFVADNDGIGSYLQGGFAQFGLAAAHAAAAGWRQGGNGGTTVIVDQIAAIRSASWDQLNESDLRLASLRILAAREWIVNAAENTAERDLLSEATTGLLSLSRRAELLNGIADRDWQRVWASITLPDLFVLGGSYLKQAESDSHPSQVTRELRRVAAANNGEGLHILGRIPSQAMGCNHPHMAPDAPYEEYERRVSVDDLAERSSEFKLYLAYRADSLGVEPKDLGRVAETLAAKALNASQMNDYHDWRSLLAAYASISNNDLTLALER